MTRRYLDRYEVAHLGAPTAFVVDLDGELDDSALAAAFGLLCVRHPALRGRVYHDGHGHVLDTRDGRHPPVRPQETGDYPREVARDWDAGRALSTVAVSRNRVALYLDHCVGDGRHMYALCQSLWRYYTDIVTGAKISVPSPRPLPPPPLAVLAERTGADVGDPTRTPPIGAALPALRYRRVLLTHDETAALVANARAHGVSVYGLLAATAAAVQRNGTDPTTIWAVIDLRDRVDPPVGATDTTNFASAATTEVTGSDLVGAAREVRAQVLAAIDTHAPHRNMVTDAVGASMTLPRPPLAAAIVSNLGVVAEFVTPPGLTVTGFRIRPYGWGHPYPMYMASTYGGRLGVDMVFRADTHDDASVTNLTAAVTGALRMARM